ncbi:MAG: type I DNA topoisomerase, partial [Micrococcales bacterium]|nr:type I DNA topoisomerase [Micrococcales bacterium]
MAEPHKLVIVESPTKAKTIESYLGTGFAVAASVGHVRDLPQPSELPEAMKKGPYKKFAVNIEGDFEPYYVVEANKKKTVAELKKALAGATELYLATDEDREGEAIAWHLLQVLKPKVPVKRMVFHEITKDAIAHALANPRQVDTDLVDAQETRRILDRLYGYEVSPVLWRKVRAGLSAGRVQSVATRLVVDRERERMAFQSAEYWDLTATMQTGAGEAFQARLTTWDGAKVAISKDFDDAGHLTLAGAVALGQAQAESLAAGLAGASFEVADLQTKPYRRRPAAPFTTSTLQQEASRKLRMNSGKTMRVAQSLYEQGYITYMRTDSTHLSGQAIKAARDQASQLYGAQSVPEKPRQYATKSKGAQEAHEAIRPSGESFATPAQLASKLNLDQQRLYDLIWKRTVASQMADARGRRLTITIQIDDAQFEVTGKTIEFPGFLRAYVEGSDDPDAELADREVILPQVKEGEVVNCLHLEAKSHTTMPPNRFSEASLTRTLEEKGIGRPSTYASIIETILNRNYVFKKGTALVPTWTAFAVCQLLETHLPGLVDYAFTAQLEDQLDAISRGEMGHVNYLKNFYFGDEATTKGKSATNAGLKKTLENKIGEIDARDISQIEIGKPENSNEAVYLRVGRFGPFLQHGDRKASVSDTLPPDELTIVIALELLSKAEQGDTPLGICPATGKPVFVKVGRFGPYVQRGASDDNEKPQNASLLPGMAIEEIDLETAIKLLSLPRVVGTSEAGEEIVASNGRFGPYIKCGSDTRSLPKDVSPLDVTEDQARELLAKPK